MNRQKLAAYDRRYLIFFICFSLVLPLLLCVGQTVLLPAVGEKLYFSPLTDSAEKWLGILYDFLETCFDYLRVACAIFTCGVVLVRQFYLPEEPTQVRNWTLAAVGALFLPYAYGILFAAFSGELAANTLFFLLYTFACYGIELLALLGALELSKYLLKKHPLIDRFCSAARFTFEKHARNTALCFGMANLLVRIFWIIMNVVEGVSLSFADIFLYLIPVVVQTAIGWLLLRLLGYDTVLFFQEYHKERE